MIDSLYFLQFACFIFMLINALILGITHLHMKWTNRRYEWSRWLILAGMTGLAIQYLLQMLLGFRAKVTFCCWMKSVHRWMPKQRRYFSTASLLLMPIRPSSV